MPDITVSQHIDDLLQSPNAYGSRLVLDTPRTSDVPSIDSFNALSGYMDNVNTTVQSNSANWDTAYNTSNSLNLSSGLWNNAYTSVEVLKTGISNILNLSGFTYTLQLSNLGSYIRKSYTSYHNIIIPSNIEVPFSIGSSFVIRNTSSNSLIISSGPTVTLNYISDLSSNILDQHFAAQIICVGTNEWDIV